MSKFELERQSRDVEKQWNLRFVNLSWRTRFVAECLTKRGITSRIYDHNAHRRQTTAQILSQLFFEILFSNEVKMREPETSMVERTHDWLMAFFEAILVARPISTQDAHSRLIKTILNNEGLFTGAGIEEWKPVQVVKCETDHTSNAIIFCDLYMFMIEEEGDQFKFHMRDDEFFLFGLALEDGFRKLLCAIRQSVMIRLALKSGNMKLCEHEKEVLEAIRNIHRTDPQALATAEAIIAFDFRSNISNFFTKTKRFKQSNRL